MTNNEKEWFTMTREELTTLQALLEQFNTEYGDDISNDRYTALVVTNETIDSIVINTESPRWVVENYDDKQRKGKMKLKKRWSFRQKDIDFKQYWWYNKYIRKR